MQSVSRREAFNVVVDGKWSLWSRNSRRLWLGGYFQYNHLAKRKNAPEGEGVNDDVTINPMLGLDMGHWSVPVHLKAGAVVNRERARVDGKWHTPCGFVAGVNARWRFLEAEENVWAGSDLFPLYPRFGSQLNLGDTYYRDKFYSRTDLTAHIVQNAFVDLNTSFTFHYTNKTTGFWQQLSCRLYIDNLLWSNRRSRERRLNSTY